MTRVKKILRVIAWAVAGLCAIILILAVAIRVDQYLLRRKAERLLADLKSLEMRKSTYQDARLVIDRWKDNIHQDGSCQPSRCDVQIALRDIFTQHQAILANHQKLAYVFGSIYRFLGVRPAMVDGTIRVRRNIVWGKGIRALTESSTMRILIGEAGSGSPLNISSLHPEYGMDSWSGCCIEAQVIFTPYTDPADVNRLMDIDFSCLTSRIPCKEKADILPTAWNEYMAEEQATNDSGKQQCSPEVIRVLSRESRHVMIGEVIKMGGASNWVCGPLQHCTLVPTPGYGEATVLLESDFKPWNPPSPAGPDYRSISHLLPMKEKLGDKYIFFFKHSIIDEYRVDGNVACSRLPATNENLEAVRRGIAEDWADHDDESSSHFGK
jgi:hypothetical protein